MEINIITQDTNLKGCFWKGAGYLVPIIIYLNWESKKNSTHTTQNATQRYKDF